MAKLQKARPVVEKKTANPTWMGRKLDAMRERFYSKDQRRDTVTAPTLSKISGRKTLHLTKLGRLLHRKRDTARPEKIEAVAELPRSNIASQSPVLNEERAVESPNSSSPKSVNSFGSVTSQEILQTSDSSSRTPVSNLAADGVDVFDFAYLDKGETKLSSTSNEAQAESNRDPIETALIDQESHIVSKESSPVHAGPSHRRGSQKFGIANTKALRLFKREEVDEKIRSALEENDLAWNDLIERTKANAPLSFTPKQLDESVAAAVEKQDSKWLSILDSKRRQFESQTEEARVAMTRKLEDQSVCLNIKAADNEARLAQDLKLKDGILEVLGNTWQTRFDQKEKDLANATDTIDTLQKLLVSRSADVASETREAAKYEQFFQNAIHYANQTYMSMDQDYGDLSNQYSELSAQSETVMEEWGKDRTKLEELRERYLNLEERHGKLMEDNQKHAVQYQTRIEELEEELDSAKSRLEQHEKAPMTFSGPSAGVFQIPFQQQSFGQQGVALQNEQPQPPSQQTFAERTPKKDESSHSRSRPSMPQFTAPLSSSSGLQAPNLATHYADDTISRSPAPFSFTSAQPSAFNFTSNPNDNASSSYSSNPSFAGSSSEQAPPKTTKKTSRFQAIFDEQAAQDKRSQPSAFGDMEDDEIR